MTIIDANYILRWFLNDIPAQADIVNTFLRDAAAASIIIERVTIAEVTYVLRSKGYNHSQIYQLFEELFYYPGCKSPTVITTKALELFRDTVLDFEDCVLLAHNVSKGTGIGTFDKAMLTLAM